MTAAHQAPAQACECVSVCLCACVCVNRHCSCQCRLGEGPILSATNKGGPLYTGKLENTASKTVCNTEGETKILLVFFLKKGSTWNKTKRSQISSPDTPSCITWLSCACRWGATWKPFRGPPPSVVCVAQLRQVSPALNSSVGLRPLCLRTPFSPALRHGLTSKWRKKI